MMLADAMRSDTANLVFEPTVQEWLDTDVVQPSQAAAEAAQEGQEGTDTRVKGEIATRPIIADDLNVTGHVGALYMSSGGKPRGRTKGTGDFHAGLRALWSFEKDPAEYPDEVADYIGDDGVGLWDGDPRKLLPESFDPYAADVPSQFKPKAGGGSWGTNLEEVMAEVGRRYTDVVVNIRDLAGKH